MVFTGSADLRLAKAVVRHLGIPLGKALVDRPSDGEVQVEIQENMCGKRVFIPQSICAPTNGNLMELMVTAGALKHASTRRIAAATSYFGYARQDRRPYSARMAITVKVVANTLEAASVEHVLTMDPHADQIQGPFDIPVDNICALPILLEDLHEKNYEDLLVVSPDVGDVVCTRALAKQLDVDLAIIDKRHLKANATEVTNIVGEVDGRNYVIMDDTIDIGGMLYKATQVLKEYGARQVFSYCTHPVLSGGAAARITGSAFDEVVVTDTILLREDAIKYDKIHQFSTTPLLAETSTRIVRDDSVMSLFAE